MLSRLSFIVFLSLFPILLVAQLPQPHPDPCDEPATPFQEECRDSVRAENRYNDSLFIQEVEHQVEPNKVLHAEPLFVDLIRDLGARKGEREWNVGFSLTDERAYDAYKGLVEYEWAPVNRLGLEVEIPFSIYATAGNPEQAGSSLPANRIESLKLAAQYSFLVSQRAKTSLAIGYIHEFELEDLNRLSFKRNLLIGHIYNPFFVAAKRWGSNIHSLLYTGPRLSKSFGQPLKTSYDAHLSVHYMISGTRNFIGIEMNTSTQRVTRTVLRPQMRLQIKDNLMVGIVTGIPLRRDNERFSTFLRLIYEPGFARHTKG